MRKGRKYLGDRRERRVPSRQVEEEARHDEEHREEQPIVPHHIKGIALAPRLRNYTIDRNKPT